MRKTIFWILMLTSIVSIVSAQSTTNNLADVMDNLGSQINFWYSSTQKISVSAITTAKVTIQSPVVKNEIGTNITKYTLMYWEHPLSEILEKTDLLNQTKEKLIDIPSTWTTFTVDLTSTDGIDSTKTYYVFLIPKDSNGTLGEVSNEIWFKLADATYGDSSTASTITTHSAPGGADMSLANVSHTLNGNQVTLTWVAVDWSDNIDIMLRDASSSSYNKLATVNMNEEKYTFTVSKNGETIVRLVPNNSWIEKNYTFSVSGLSDWTVTTPEIKKVPQTWTEENIAIVVILSAIIYFWYKKAYRKH